MAKKVDFSQVSNGKESDQRMNMRTVPDTTPEPVREPDSHMHLDALGTFMRTRTDDQMLKLGIHPVHTNMVRELFDRKNAGKRISFSDGTKEMLANVHRKLIK